MAKISASGQDYLEALLELSGGIHPVRSVDLANRIGVSRASVNKAIGVLKNSGFVLQERYSDIILTEEGSSAAKAVRKRHTVLKTFLQSALQVSAKNAEEDACKMEHVISLETLEKLQNFLVLQGMLTKE